ncbi:MAG: beta-lactamase family protein [Acidobacteria bacterium]|nr:beta-lactamase family protein [Acidobacteriota bacterium]MCI0721339.1 beta-lactamase family protein [Acidobacteriota bacterium]
MRHVFAYVCVFFLVSCCQAHAAEVDSEALDRYPGPDWEHKKPSEVGFDEKSLYQLLPKVGIGGVIIRHGYQVASWGNLNTAVQTASMGKSFTSTCLGLAVDAGLVRLDDPVWKTWTGEGDLSHPHKYLNFGHHRQLTWRHFANMTSGFPDVDLSRPDGEMGDQTYNYAHRPPGEEYEYSDPGMWRYSQSLTKLWAKDLKTLLDEKIFQYLGVPAGRWGWMPGKAVHDNLLYPFWPGYGRYLDPPWEIDGNVIRAGPGWVVISASDAARFGYLFLRNGRWKGRQLVSESWIRQTRSRQSRRPGASGGEDYSLNWWLPGQGVQEARGANINWQAVSRISIVPEYDLVVATIRTNYVATKVVSSTYFGPQYQGDRDWIFRVLQTIVR